MPHPSSVRPFLLFILILAGTWSAPAKAQWIDGGGFHTCALDAAGRSSCWGADTHGQLGDGIPGGSRTTVAPVTGLPDSLTIIAAGDSHSCALTASQGVKCWGWNAYGQLGDGTNQSSAVPVDVQGLTSGVSEIAVGGSHTCAILLTGSLKCWGYNGNGQLGDGTTTDRNLPGDVTGLPGVVYGVSTGLLHTCVMTQSGGVKCWGENFLGALGDGTRTDRYTPVDVVGLSSGAVSLATGIGHTCALGAQGLWLRCWGRNEYGQVGDNSYTFAFHTEPVDVANVPGTIAMIAAGGFHTCLLTTGGDVSCWGSNEFGQLANGGTGWGAPAPVPSLTGGVTRIGAGFHHTCAISTDGLARCWGRNDNGQLGDGTSGTNRTTPVVVAGFFAGGGTLPPMAAQTLAAGGVVTCALDASGGLDCWGENVLGALGDGTAVSRTVPGPVSGLSSGVASVAAGSSHACAITAAGGAKCWGDNVYGALGDGTNFTRRDPVDVTGLDSGVAGISAGNSHTCALTSVGGVKCWGSNSNGQLGFVTTGDSELSPGDVPGLGSGLVAVSASKAFHTCALRDTGEVACWGSNFGGQLGDGSTTDSTSPVAVAGLPAQARAISTGANHSCALTGLGGVHCWGRNDWGQLGDGTSMHSPSPVAVSGLSSGVAAIAAGGYHTCALMTSGGVQCWGLNEYGELGDGSAGYARALPDYVAGLTSDVVELSAGNRHNCVRLADDTLRCWGLNQQGQLGIGNTTNQTTPAGVVTYMGGDIVPDVFAFTPATGVALGALVTSGPVTITGITMPAIVSVTGGEYSVGCTATYTADFGIVLAGQSVCVRHTASALPSTSTTTTLTVSTVSASFTSTTSGGVVLNEYLLTVTKSGTGSGTVTSNPVGINCGATCQFLFGDATVVSLTATADAGSVFAGWSGACTGTGACSFTMSQARTVTASFTLADTVPDAFSFGTKSAVTPGATVTSKAETITGINAPAPVTVANGTYAINCQEPYVSTPGTITNGQTVCVQHVAAPTALTSRTTTLTIGGERGDFTSTTSGTAQAITFGQLLDRAVGSAPFDLFAFASSGLPVTFSSQTLGACTVSGNTVTIVAAGTCTIAANQGGNASFGAAPTVTRSFVVASALEPNDIKAIAAGGSHTCVLTNAGGVKCWGENQYGQLGDGTMTNRSIAVDVIGLSSGVVAIDTGILHTCAVLFTGGVKCWGFNRFGQLGDGTRVEVRLAPVDVVGLGVGVTSIGTGGYHTCALTAAGGVKCWGQNESGQLGDGTVTDRRGIVDVPGLGSGIVAIAVGHSHNCALTVGGGKKCWGNNAAGQLGDGTRTMRPTPTDVSGLDSGIVAFAAGEYHTCAITTGGGAKCWGNGGNGQLGIGFGDTQLTPVDVLGLDGGTMAIDTGSVHTCALTTSGGAKCWGFNAGGELGDGTTTQRMAPVDVVGLGNGGIAVVTGSSHSCALTRVGGVKCWGSNGWGTLGDGSLADSTAPVDVTGLSGGDTTPDAFAFTSQSNVARGSTVTSNAVTLSGLAEPSLVSVSNGSYSIGCGATFTSDPGVIMNGQSVCVRHVASGGYGLSVTTTLTVGGVSGTFTSTTAGATLQQYLLTVTKSGPGSGTVTSNLAGINCGVDCSALFGDADVVTLSAVADANSVFAGWNGACAGAGACSVSMSQARSVSAAFTLADKTPDPFSFETQTNVRAFTYVTSNTVTITGINVPVEISVSGGSYSIGCVAGTFVTTPGLVSNGQTVCVQHESGSTGTSGRCSSRTTSLSVGGVTATFTSETISGVNQDIWWLDPLPTRSVGIAPFKLIARTSSRLPVSFSSNTPATCTVSDGMVTILGPGICTIRASQAGSCYYGPTSGPTRSFEVVANAGDPVSIKAGVSHTCALTAGGGVKCWGGNELGQVGDGSTETRESPVEVVGTGGIGRLSGVSAIAAGAHHTCAITAGGEVQCWGDGLAGQLGNGSLASSTVPVKVLDLPAAVAIAAGDTHTCAITLDRAVLCWGSNESGQLGTGIGASSRYPVAVNVGSNDLYGAVAVAAGGSHACVIMSGGRGVKCWGLNDQGQLGDGSQVNRAVPVDVSPGYYAQITAGYKHTCVMTEGGIFGGGASCWGNNTHGQLGDGSPSWDVNALVPVAVIDPAGSGDLGGVATLSAGDWHTCALATDGRVLCWGRNDRGQLGDASTTDRRKPVAVRAAGGAGTVSGASAIATGAFHSCATLATGEAICWGANAYAQLGGGSAGADRTIPAAVLGFTRVDSAPDGLAFTSKQGVGIGTLQTSNPVTPAGFTNPAPVSVAGGEYSIGCTTAFTAAAGTINPGQSVCVRHVASSSYSTPVTTTLTIGGVSGTFTSTTAGPPELSPSAAGVPFGNVAVGARSANQAITITNVGGHAASALGVGVNGDFRIESTTCGATLAAGAGCDVSISFAPTGVGSRAGELLVTAQGVLQTGRVFLTGTGVATDVTPNAFTFTDQYLVAPSMLITSAPVQMTGLTGAATVSVANGSYCVSATNSCSSCTFRQDPSTVTNGQYLCARHTSSPVPGGQVDTLVFVGGMGDAFTSITIDTVPAAFSFPAVSGVQPATTQASAAAAITGINAPSPVSVVGGEYSVGCTGTWTSTAGTVANGQTVCVRHVAAGTYSATTSTTLTIGGVTGSFVSTTAPATSIPRLGNISTRMQVLTGNDVLIGGFIIGGSAPKTVVVRARGPSLAPFGITNFLANPKLDLYSGQTVIASNDDWATATNAAALTASGFAPENAQEAAVLVTLSPGAYTAVVSGSGGGTGVGIVEVFEVDLPEVPLANISTRGQVLTGNDVMIGGFVIQGSAPQTVIVRARGPSLADFGITNPLANPVLQLFSGQTMVAMNDNWQSSAEAGQVLSRGFAPASPFESAILITLNPGAYTAIVTGAGGTTGVGIIEVFAQ